MSYSAFSSGVSAKASRNSILFCHFLLFEHPISCEMMLDSFHSLVAYLHIFSTIWSVYARHFPSFYQNSLKGHASFSFSGQTDLAVFEAFSLKNAWEFFSCWNKIVFIGAKFHHMEFDQVVSGIFSQFFNWSRDFSALVS